MNRGEDSDSIPNDLVLEILSRLPAKSVGKFRCVSKLWASILCSQDFTKLFLTKSSARPRLLYVVIREGEYFFYSLPQSSQNPSLVVELHMKFHADVRQYMCSYASGLLYVPVPDLWMSKSKGSVCAAICNPSTGRCVSLPHELDNHQRSQSFLGFDPIGKEYKVLFMKRNPEWVYHILTLGTAKLSWRKIQCPFSHDPMRKEICINGVLYYLASYITHVSSYLLVCFDVRSEKFKFIDVTDLFYPYIELINYKGKLGGGRFEYNGKDGCRTRELCLWVLEDVEKQEWSKYIYSLPKIKVRYCDYNTKVVGMTTAGEIVILDLYINPSRNYYVHYFNPERHTIRSVEIQGLGINIKSSVYAFVDYIEDLSLNDSKQLIKSQPQQRLHIS